MRGICYYRFAYLTYFNFHFVFFRDLMKFYLALITKSFFTATNILI
jgi:hypothetical protein